MRRYYKYAHKLTQDTVIHMEVDEEQWKITQGSKRQAKWVWSPRAMSGLRLPDAPHALKHKQRSTRLDRKQETEKIAVEVLAYFWTVANQGRSCRYLYAL